MPTTAGTMFLNPSSGAGLSDSDLQELHTEAGKAGVEVIPLTEGFDVTQTIRERLSRGIRLFIAAGGDGTVNHVVQPLVNSEGELGVLPMGTYNHFARDLDMPLDWREALEVVLHGARRQVDTARVNDRYFVNNLSLGLYPELVAKREEQGRETPRWKARLSAAYHTLRKYPHVTLAIESDAVRETIRTHVFLISNNRYDLSRVGIEAARDSLQEGRLSVYWLPHMPRLAMTRFVISYLGGRVTSTPGFRSFRTVRLKAQSLHGRLKVGIDGEVFRLGTPLTITSVPQSLVVRVPRQGG